MSTPRQEQIARVLKWMDATPGNSRKWADNLMDWSRRNENERCLVAWLVKDVPPAGATDTSHIADIVVRRLPLQNVTIIGGSVFADDAVFDAVMPGAAIVGVVIADDRSALLAYVPFPGPLVPDGGDITINWNRNNGIFAVGP